jgi:GNAT superfamily N-acetyltransferase
MFATASLAARIERAECTMLMELARAAAVRLGRGEVVVAPIGGGVAVYTGAGSPANKLAGLGFGDLPPSAELETIENAFALRRAPLQAEVASLGDPVVLRMLSRRGYELIGFENVLGLPLDLAAMEERVSPSVTVERAGPDDTSAWMDAVATGFLHPDTFDGPESHESFSRDVIEQIFGDTFATPSFERFIARRDGVIAGGASLRIHQGVAQLAGAATLPQHRRQGVQTALLKHRLLDAAQRGCDVAVVTTQPGSKSTENVQRFGFAVLYVRAIMIREGLGPSA